MAEYIVKTWKEIARYTPYSCQTLQKKYGPDMLKQGFVIKSHIGKSKKHLVWAFPSQIIRYFTLQSQKNEIV